MRSRKHPLDVVAEQLEALADGPVAAQEASPDYWELRSATDESVGDYPQVVWVDPKQVLEWGDTEGLGPDGFPAVAIPELKLQRKARWTDVLSSSLWSGGHLFSDEALAVFRQHDLGQVREYPVRVRGKKGDVRALTYLHFRNIVEPTAIDFERSEFYLADMLSIPTGPVVINSFDEWETKTEQAMDGELDGCEEFSQIEYKRLYFRPGHSPTVAYFRLARLGITVYISTRLKEAILSSGITGLEIRPNKRLFAQR
jgi:hypothetical protein